MRRVPIAGGAAVLAAVAAFAVVVGVSWHDTKPQNSAHYTVAIPPALDGTLDLTPRQVAATVLRRLRADTSIIKIVALLDSTQLRRVEPGAFGAPPHADSLGPLWYVRASGYFLAPRSAPGSPPATSATAWYVILDRDGSILEFGMP